MKKDLLAKTSLTINAPRIKVWDALVNPEAIKQYMFGTMLSQIGKKGVRSFGKENGRENRMKIRE